MNSKAIQLAISTLVLFIIGSAVLIGIVILLTGGFKSFKESTDPFLDSSLSASIRQACQLACDQQIRLSFCCEEYDVDDEIIKCTDQRLDLECSLDCTDFECGPQ